MNPARSLGPALIGWTWTAQWVYMLAPLLGAAAGAYVYRLLRDAGRAGTRVTLETSQTQKTEENHRKIGKL